MPKILPRLVALILLPWLLVDPVLARGFRSASERCALGLVQGRGAFDAQALAVISTTTPKRYGPHQALIGNLYTRHILESEAASAEWLESYRSRLREAEVPEPLFSGTIRVLREPLFRGLPLKLIIKESEKEVVLLAERRVDKTWERRGVQLRIDSAVERYAIYFLTAYTERTIEVTLAAQSSAADKFSQEIESFLTYVQLGRKGDKRRQWFRSFRTGLSDPPPPPAADKPKVPAPAIAPAIISGEILLNNAYIFDVLSCFLAQPNDFSISLYGLSLISVKTMADLAPAVGSLIKLDILEKSRGKSPRYSLASWVRARRHDASFTKRLLMDEFVDRRQISYSFKQLQSVQQKLADLRRAG